MQNRKQNLKISAVVGIVATMMLSAIAGYQFNNYRQQQAYKAFFTANQQSDTTTTTPEEFFDYGVNDKKTSNKT